MLVIDACNWSPERNEDRSPKARSGCGVVVEGIEVTGVFDVAIGSEGTAAGAGVDGACGTCAGVADAG